MGHDLICKLCGRSWEIGEKHWQHSSWRKRATGLSPKKYRYAYREVDIEAMDRKELVFVEVRTRRPGNFGTPEESVSAHKLRRLMATCQDYIQKSGREAVNWRVALKLKPGKGPEPQGGTY